MEKNMLKTYDIHLNDDKLLNINKRLIMNFNYHQLIAIVIDFILS